MYSPTTQTCRYVDILDFESVELIFGILGGCLAMSVYGDFMLMVLPDSAYIYELKGEATRTQLVLVNTFHLDNEDCHAFGASLCSVPQTMTMSSLIGYLRLPLPTLSMSS